MQTRSLFGDLTTKPLQEVPPPRPTERCETCRNAYVRVPLPKPGVDTEDCPAIDK